MSNAGDNPGCLILGMGNPLLDMSAIVDLSILDKYNLKANDAILYEKEDIFEELQKDYTVEYIAGGATQNSIRVAQWILGSPDGRVAYFGSVGKDEASRILCRVADAAGIKAIYQESVDYPTGRCAVLVTGVNRSLVTKLDAANHFTKAHLDVAANWKVVEEAKIFYSAGFFLTVSPESMLLIAKHAAPLAEKRFCMNLSAPFICQFFKEPLNEVMAYSDVVVGNETEAETYAEHHGFPPEIAKDRKEIALRIAGLPYKGAPSKSRIVIITQGCDPCIIVEAGVVKERPVHKLQEEKIVDTNGAGDAFVGGVLAQLALGKTTEEAVDCGLWAAKEILLVSGCKCNPDKIYKA